MRSAQILFDAQQIEALAAPAEPRGLASRLAAPGKPLQVVETRSSLDIREGVRVLKLAPAEHFPARQSPFELPNELLKVVGYHPVEAHQLAVTVIQHLGLGWLPREQKSSAAGEGLDVSAMRGIAHQGQQVGQQAGLPARPGEQRGRLHSQPLRWVWARLVFPARGAGPRPIARGLYACVAAPGRQLQLSARRPVLRWTVGYSPLVEVPGAPYGQAAVCDRPATRVVKPLGGVEDHLPEHDPADA